MEKKKASTSKPFVDPEDAPELTQEWFAEADLHDGEKVVRRGRPPSPDKKELVSIRLSPDVLTAFRATGPGWQTRIDEALRRLVSRRGAKKPATAKPSGRTLRKVP